MQLLILFLTSLFIAMATVPLLMKLAGRLRFVDLPNERKVHTSAIPRVGGIGMVLGTLATLLLWLEADPTLRMVCLGVGLLSAFGIADDRLDLDYRLKFLGQFLAVMIVVGLGGVVVRRVELLGPGLLPGWFAYPLTVLFLMGTTNAMNLSDGLDGLAAGLSVLSLAAIAYLADLAGGETVIAVAVATIGSILGFLRYNTHPALVFMGDTGSQFLGFSAGVWAVLVTQEVNTAISGALPLLILGLPVVDTLLVMGGRIARRVSPFKPDRNHFHHKLLSLGFDHYEAVLAIYALQATFILLACLLRYESDAAILAIYLALFLAIGAFFPLAQGLRWRLRRLAQGKPSPLARVLESLARSPRLEQAAFHAVASALPLLLLAGSLAAPAVRADIGVSAAAVLVAWAVAVLSKARGLAVLERPALYLGVILVVYLVGIAGPERPALERHAQNLAMGLAAMVGLGSRLSRRYFSVTPSDFLVLFVLVAAASLPVFSGVNYARLAVWTAVALYGVEYVLRRREGPSRRLRAGGMLALAVVAARGGWQWLAT
jgi:UDP-GlcNAc:undecaprenyl-phosphate GlcNAc-1-phosphate transferase